jgi:hypothetical protein
LLRMRNEPGQVEKRASHRREGTDRVSEHISQNGMHEVTALPTIVGFDQDRWPRSQVAVSLAERRAGTDAARTTYPILAVIAREVEQQIMS